VSVTILTPAVVCISIAIPFFAGLRKFLEALGNPAIEAVGWKLAITLWFPGLEAGQKLNGFVYVGDRIDPESVLGNRLPDIGPEHQVLNIACRKQNALAPNPTSFTADIEKAFDLLIHATHRLNFTMLVHGPRYGEGLPDWHPGNG
jgi:hypothetical protein